MNKVNYKAVISDTDYPPAQTIIFIGANGKETWIGTLKGLKDMYPKCRVIKIALANCRVTK